MSKKPYSDSPKEPPFLRTPFNYDTNTASDHHGLKCLDKSLTREEFAEECNINWIADRYKLTELDPAIWQSALPTVVTPPSYGDFTGVFDFQAQQNAVREALEGFMTLPAKLRARFDNNPQRLIDFLADPDNRKEAEFLGLVQEKETTNAPGTTSTPPQNPQSRARDPRTQADTPETTATEGPEPQARQNDPRRA